jgi:hypothetical protein
MIEKGDMVQLVWACCAQGRRHIGWTGTVLDIRLAEYPDEYSEFSCCGLVTHGIHARILVERDGWVPLP